MVKELFPHAVDQFERTPHFQGNKLVNIWKQFFHFLGVRGTFELVDIADVDAF